MRGKTRAKLGIVLGLFVGSLLYALTRLVVPDGLAVGSALVGVSAGLGARLGRAFGGQLQLRAIIFGSMVVVMGTEYAIYERGLVDHDATDFTAFLLADPTWAVHTAVFLVGGIFLGVRILVGTDVLSDVLAHGDAAMPAGSPGTPCPRCDSSCTQVNSHSLELVCADCDHGWAPK